MTNEKMFEILNITMTPEKLITIREESRREGFNQGLSKAEVIIDELYPDCYCLDNEVLRDCKDEWIECWSHELNREIRQKIKEAKQ